MHLSSRMSPSHLRAVKHGLAAIDRNLVAEQDRKLPAVISLPSVLVATRRHQSPPFLISFAFPNPLSSSPPSTFQLSTSRTTSSTFQLSTFRISSRPVFHLFLPQTRTGVPSTNERPNHKMALKRRKARRDSENPSGHTNTDQGNPQAHWLRVAGCNLLRA